jgi:hypothetical protein
LKVAFTCDGRRFLAASESSVRVWELPFGPEVFRFRVTSTHTPAIGILARLKDHRSSYEAERC